MKIATHSFAQLATDLVGGVKIDHKVTLILEQCLIAVHCSGLDLADNLRHYFAPFLDSSREKPHIHIHVVQSDAPQFDVELKVKTPDPGKTKIKEEWLDLGNEGRLVRKRLTGMTFLFGGISNFAVGPCLENVNQVINFVNNRFIAWKLNQGNLLGHAAAVLHNGQGMAMAGFSGMGKSTLALHLMSKGTTFVSNDRLLVDATGNGTPQMSGVAKLPRINPGTALNNPKLASVMSPEDQKYFSTMPINELWEVEHKYDVFIDECFGPDKFVLGANMDFLILLNWERGTGPMVARQIDLAQHTNLLPAFMKSTGLFYLPEEDNPKDQPIDKYIEVLSRSQVIELTGGIDFVEATEVCMALFDQTANKE